jgi:uncharacterized protein YlaI
MERKELIEKLKRWNFEKNSKKMFAEKYNISVKTVDRYTEKYNIPYEKRVFEVAKNRDKHGKFVYDEPNNQTNDQLSNQSTTDKQSEASSSRFENKPIRSLKEYNKKYDKYFSS